MKNDSIRSNNVDRDHFHWYQSVIGLCSIIYSYWFVGW